MSAPNVNAHGVVEPPSHAARILSGAIAALAQSVQAIRLYGPDHPQTKKLLAQAESHFRATTLDDAPLCTVVTPDTFLLGDEPLGTPVQLSAIALTLRKNDIAAIEWLARPAADDLAKLSAWLADQGAEPGPAGMSARCGSWLRPVGVAGDTLRFIDSLDQSGTPGRDRRSLVSALRATVNDSFDPGHARAFEALQAALSSAPQDQAAKAAVVLQSISAVKLSGTSNDGPTDSPAVIPAMDAVLGALSPELRSSLLNVGVVTGGSWIADNAQRLPIGEVAGMFHALDQSGQKPSNSAVMLLQKLIGLSSLSTDVRQRLEYVSSKWESRPSPGSTTTGQAALEELMSDRGVQDFCPDDYRDHLTSAATAPRAHVLSPIGLSDIDPAQTLLRTGEIAAWLLDDSPGDGLDNSGPLLALAHDAPGLLAVQRRDLVLKAALYAATIPSSAAPALLDAARAAKDAIATPAMLDAVLARPATDPGALDEARAISAIAPIPTLTRVCDRIAQGRMSPQHAVARAVAQTIPSADWRQYLTNSLTQALAAPAPDHAAFLPLLDHINPAMIESVCEPWLTSPDPALRGHALGILDRRVIHWSVQTHRIALATGVEKLQAFSLRRIASATDPIDPELLAHAIDGTLSGRIAGGKTLAALVSIMIRHGPEGRVLLANLLYALSRGVALARIRACRRIAAELEPHRSELPVARALQAWRRSLAHTIGLFVEDDLARAAA